MTNIPNLKTECSVLVTYIITSVNYMKIYLDNLNIQLLVQESLCQRAKIWIWSKPPTKLPISSDKRSKKEASSLLHKWNSLITLRNPIPSLYLQERVRMEGLRLTLAWSKATRLLSTTWKWALLSLQRDFKLPNKLSKKVLLAFKASLSFRRQI